MQALDDRMVTDDLEPTQQQTESSQGSSQQDKVDSSQLWGFLVPCSSSLRRLDLLKIKDTYRIGRNREQGKNDIILPGMKISECSSLSARVSTRLTTRVTRSPRTRQLPRRHRVGRGRHHQVGGQGHGHVQQRHLRESTSLLVATFLSLMRMRFKINGQKIGRGKCKVLRDGNEIAFGTAAPQGANGGFEDYRE